MQTSVEFFDNQFSKQVLQERHVLNPFELLTLPYLAGELLDFGCGLGNLSIAAAEAGCNVIALDASPTAITYLQEVASRRGLRISAIEADLRSYRIDTCFDTVVSIGLLMFFDRRTALAQLAQMQSRVRPGGILSVNVLIEGTTFLSMFDPASYYLFGADELSALFAGWDILAESFNDFEAPQSTVKRFATVIARRKV
jgi:tellurite methyltransferase